LFWDKHFDNDLWKEIMKGEAAECGGVLKWGKNRFWKNMPRWEGIGKVIVVVRGIYDIVRLGEGLTMREEMRRTGMENVENNSRFGTIYNKISYKIDTVHHWERFWMKCDIKEFVFNSTVVLTPI
jgi:hypothetical protein